MLSWCCVSYVFFFFKQKTAYEMRISDWSSDVCSSDLDAVEIAGDRQAAAGAAVREHRGRGHEPQLRDIVVEALGMIGVVGIGGGDAGEEILIGFAGEEIAVRQRLLAELGEQRVAARVGLGRESAAGDCVQDGSASVGGRVCRYVSTT